MKLLKVIRGAFNRHLVLAVFMSIFSGSSMTALVALLGRQFTTKTTLNGWTLGLLCGITLLAIGADLAGKWLLTRALGWTGYELRMSLARQILAKPYPQLETIGVTRLQALFFEGTYHILQALHQIPSLAVALATLLGSLLYLGWLAPAMLGVLLLLAIPMIGGHWLFQRKATAALKVVQATRDQTHHYYRALIEGVKELKIHNRRRYAFYTQLLQPAASLTQQQGILSRNWHYLANTWSQSTYFIFILGVLGMATWQPTHSDVIATYALIILYMKSAVNVLLSSSAQWHEADMACHHLEALGFALAPQSQAVEPPPAQPDCVDAHQPERGNLALPTLEFREVVYHYQDQAAEQRFTLGPINLTLQAGELIFITGGNGSGKTTLVKILTGLYPPAAGCLYWGGSPVTAQSLDRYQQLFAVIFADFYLFEQLLGLDASDQHVAYYLHKLKLQHKVVIHDGVFSTTNLSQGQRKRLALLTAYLEDRPIYIFDEWASEQDPEFREIFYHQLLPELKARGKLVIVISHDSQYYAIADRVIRLHQGQIEGNEDAVRNMDHQYLHCNGA